MSNPYQFTTPTTNVYQTGNSGMPANVQSMTQQYFQDQLGHAVPNAFDPNSRVGFGTHESTFVGGPDPETAVPGAEPHGGSASAATTIGQQVVNEAQIYVIPSQNIAYTDQMSAIWGAVAYSSGTVVNQAPSYVTHPSIPSTAFSGTVPVTGSTTIINNNTPPSIVDKAITGVINVGTHLVQGAESLATKAVDAVVATPIGQKIQQEWDKDMNDFNNSKVGQGIEHTYDTVKNAVENGWHAFESWL